VGQQGGQSSMINFRGTQNQLNFAKKDKRNSKILHGSVQRLQDENWNRLLAKFEGEACEKQGTQVSYL